MCKHASSTQHIHTGVERKKEIHFPSIHPSFPSNLLLLFFFFHDKTSSVETLLEGHERTIGILSPDLGSIPAAWNLLLQLELASSGEALSPPSSGFRVFPPIQRCDGGYPLGNISRNPNRECSDGEGRGSEPESGLKKEHHGWSWVGVWTLSLFFFVSIAFSTVIWRPPELSIRSLEISPSLGRRIRGAKQEGIHDISLATFSRYPSFIHSFIHHSLFHLPTIFTRKHEWFESMAVDGWMDGFISCISSS